ncbi:pRL2-19 [Kitasatospora sp. HPMI-4]|uniref:pRL2-19 n=1 Tax=Kitasatospora sp. HPMI-4 TaxID=3448443 RepID=UPI003F1BAE99
MTSHNPDLPNNEDMSHGLLLALIMHLGGSVDLPASAFESDALGGSQGEFYAVQLDPLNDTTVRLSVVPRPPGV